MRRAVLWWGASGATSSGLRMRRHDHVDRLDDEEEDRGLNETKQMTVVDELAVEEVAAVDRGERLLLKSP